jgi:hypothetical protein
MLSAAMLLAPGCGRDERKATSNEAPVRRAAFLTMIAQDFLASCPGGARAEGQSEVARYAELKRLGFRKGAGHAIWLGENDFGGTAQHSDRPPCRAGEQAYSAALAAYSASLDGLAGRLVEFRE